MITKRQENILKFLAEEYIKTAKPVSSSTICKYLKCSSATIRNEMVILDELGYLEKNHFASGRIPSEKGYKYYVDKLMSPKNMTGEEMLKLQTIFHNKALDLNDIILKSIELISEMTNYTSVVLGKSSNESLLKKVEVVPLENDKVLTMVITDKGHVEYKNMYLPNTDIEEVIKTVNLINRMIVGTPIDCISERLEYDIKPNMLLNMKYYIMLFMMLLLVLQINQPMYILLEEIIS